MDREEDRIAVLLSAGVSDDEITRRLGVSFLEILGRRGEAASAPSKIARDFAWPARTADATLRGPPTKSEPDIAPALQ